MDAIGAGGVEPLRKGATGTTLLAPAREGFCVDYSGLLKQARDVLLQGEIATGLAELLRHLAVHLEELGQGWYAGDTAVVEEFLQLYCIEEDARDKLVGAIAKRYMGH